MALCCKQSIKSTLLLNTTHYTGGIAIWGALPPVFDTKKHPIDKGIHVHARDDKSRKKLIDATYDLVEVQHSNRSFLIDEEMAVMFSLASIFNLKMDALICPRCHQYILSKELFSLIPHHEHLCLHCGHLMITDIACISNPIISFKESFNDKEIQRPIAIPNRSIQIEPGKYPGGVEIWGSNPSIVWTSDRPEESAIHVHAYNKWNERVIDNTYGKVYLSEELLDITMIKYLQIQLQFPEIYTKLNCIKCHFCHYQQFDQGIYAIIPQQNRICQSCKLTFTSHPSVSNPAVEIIKWYTETDNEYRRHH